MNWINFLHLYQPANATDDNIREATEKSYKYILDALESSPLAKITVNITGCLFLRWQELDYNDVIERLKKLVRSGQIEITGTAAYHPLLPLIKTSEAKKQIQENEAIQKKFLSPAKSPSGFFLPEMAYSLKMAKLIKSLGYEWLILDELSASEKIDNKLGYTDKAGLKIIFRQRSLSQTYVPETLHKLSIKKAAGQKNIITATDAEIYGLRHIDNKKYFLSLLKNGSVNTLTVSQYLQNLKTTKKLDIINSSWESTRKEIEQGEPYALWQGQNKLHEALWCLADTAQDVLDKNVKDKNYEWARWHFVRGLASCTFWWASGRDFRKVFGPIAWNPDEVEKNINELARSIRSLDSVKTVNDKINFEKLQNQTKSLLWQMHWKKYK